MQKQLMQRFQMQQVRTQFWLTVSQPIGLVGTGLMLGGATIALPASIAQASSLQWQYDPSSAALSVNLPPGATPRYFLAAQPARIVVDLPNTDVGAVQTEKQFPGAVQQIRIAQFQPGVTRIVMQLAPGTVLAPQQVDLQQSGDRWVLRPILADASSARSQTIASQIPGGTIAAANPPQAASPAANAAPAPETSASETLAPETSASETPIAANQPTSNLPPLEPGATEIPVELPPAEAAAAAPPTVSVPALSAAAPNPTPATAAPTQSSSSAEAIVEPSAAANPTSLTAAPVPESPAPAASPTSAPLTSAPQTPSVQASETQAPALQADEQAIQAEQNPAEATTAALPAELPPAEPASLPTELPPATFTPSGESTVNVPALNPPSSTSPNLNSPSPSPARNREVAAIEFGQPLPGTESASQPTRATSREASRERPRNTVAVNSTPGVLLPAGTVLNLRYQGEETLNLAGDYPLQEVLVVDRDVRDQSGQVVVPAGSQVIGRFETGSSGSEFIAQAISINGQSFLLNGRSDKLSGDRQVSGNHMMRNSALGAVAGTLLGAVTGVGLIAGIAAGAASSAATTYLTAPQPAVIEPDRVVEVRLQEDLRQPGYGIGG